MDNWTKQEALYYTESQEVEEKLEVKDLIDNVQWNICKLEQLISLEMVEYTVGNINPNLST